MIRITPYCVFAAFRRCRDKNRKFPTLSRFRLRRAKMPSVSGSPRARSVGTRGSTSTKIGTLAVYDGNTFPANFQLPGVGAPRPTIAPNIGQILTLGPGIALQQGGASTLGKSARGRDKPLLVPPDRFERLPGPLAGPRRRARRGCGLSE